MRGLYTGCMIVRRRLVRSLHPAWLTQESGKPRSTLRSNPSVVRVLCAWSSLGDRAVSRSNDSIARLESHCGGAVDQTGSPVRSSRCRRNALSVCSYGKHAVSSFISASRGAQMPKAGRRVAVRAGRLLLLNLEREMPRPNPRQPGHGRKSANSESAHPAVTHSPDPEPPSPEQLACLAEMVVEARLSSPAILPRETKDGWSC